METYYIVIDDLELFEAKEIVAFLKNAIESGDLPFPIQDCISITDKDANIIESHEDCIDIMTDDGK